MDAEEGRPHQALQEQYIRYRGKVKQQEQEWAKSTAKYSALLWLHKSVTALLLLLVFVLSGSVLVWRSGFFDLEYRDHPYTAFSQSEGTIRGCAQMVDQGVLDSEHQQHLETNLTYMAQHMSDASSNSTAVYTLATSLFVTLEAAVISRPWWHLGKWFHDREDLQNDRQATLLAQREDVRMLHTILSVTSQSYWDLIDDNGLGLDEWIGNNLEHIARIDSTERDRWLAGLSSDLGAFDHRRRQIDAWNATAACHLHGLAQAATNAIWLKQLGEYIQEIDRYLEGGRFLERGFPQDLKTLVVRATPVLFQPQVSEQGLDELVRRATERFAAKKADRIR